MSEAVEQEPAPQPEAPAGGGSMVDRMREARVELRSDLDVSRHVFRGEISYVIQDPLTFQSHRFGVEDYRILTQLSVDQSLAECFAGLVESGELDAEDEERFFQFVFSLHRYGFLKLPVSDDGTLYRRHVAKREQREKGRFKSILFLPVPLWNPDAFLTRTMHLVRPLCTKAAFGVWSLLVATALWVLVANWAEFQRPVTDIFSGSNLPLLWITLVVLKVVHEFGHAYACKHFGGHVPEMGVMLILFTPCAFVDASSSWGFSRKRERLVVNMAGMYVELLFAAVAMILWAMTPPGVWRQCLHNVVLLASVVTIGFNVNPLMRYDGYYALSDLVEVPNLRSRSTAYATALMKKVVLGVPMRDVPASPGMRAGLLAFGVAGAIYKVTLVLGISIAIAMKFFVGGLLLGGLYFLGEIVRIARATFPYLWSSDEIAGKRLRARMLSILLAGGIPLLVAGVPVPARVKSPGVVVGGSQTVVRAEASGFLSEVSVRPGERVRAGEVFVQLEEPDKLANLEMTSARLRATRLRESVFEVSDLPRAAEEGRRAEQLEDEVQFLTQDLERLSISDPEGGVVVSCIGSNDVGRLVKRGEEIAVVSRGRLTVRALLTEDDVAATRPEVGMVAEFRTQDDPTRSWKGIVRRIEPVGSKRLDEDFLDHLDLSEFSLHPVTQEASRSQFEIRVELDPGAVAAIRHGMTGRLAIGGDAETLGQVLYRRLVTFANRL